MVQGNSLQDSRIVRLNARLMPVHPAEVDMYRRFGIRPAEVEASSPEEILSHVAGADGIFVVSAALPGRVVEGMDRCRVISRLGNGTDKIDVAAAARKGILVTNVPSFCVEEMADHAMAMLLSLARRVPRMSAHMRAGAYRQAREESVRLQRLSGRTLGLVGFGASARATAARARAFGLRLLATRRHKGAPRTEADALGVEMVDLDTLLARSDFVSLHLPLTAETYHMLDAAALRRMKAGACLINTSRGALVDEGALAEALREGRLAGAGLDTFEEIEIFSETAGPPDHPLVELDNVILTPHVSGLSVQALEDVARTGVANLACVLSGHYPPPENIVNRGVVPRVPLAEYDPSLFSGEM